MINEVCQQKDKRMRLVILLLSLSAVALSQSCSTPASVFLLQSNNSIPTDENITQLTSGLNCNEEDNLCCYCNKGVFTVLACGDIESALDAINTDEYKHHILVLGEERKSLNYTLGETWSRSGHDPKIFPDESSITIIGRGSPTIYCEDSGVQLRQFCNVTIINVSWDSCSINNEGGIILSNIRHIALQSVTISNSNSTGLLINSSSQDNTVELVSLYISGCTFSNNSGTKQGGGLSINNVLMGPSPSLVIENTAFIDNNAINGGGMSILEQIYTCDSLTISNSTFSGNNAGGDGGGLFINAVSIISLEITGTNFTNNKATRSGGGAHIIMQSSSSCPVSPLSFCNVRWVSNTAPQSFAMKLDTHESRNLYANIEHNVFENNTYQKQYLGGDTTCTMHSDGFNIYMYESNFTHNRGAGMCIKRASLKIPSNALFYHNSAYKGAGIYLDDDSYLQLGPEAFLNFTRNSAVYGGGIYQKSIISTNNPDSDRICFLMPAVPRPRLKFQDNIATISGRAIFFNDPIKSCKEELYSLNIIYDDDDGPNNQLTSSATSISFSDTIKNNATTLVLGQRLLLKADITDIFGNLTFALISIFLLPQNSSLFTDLSYKLVGEKTFTIENGFNRPNLYIAGPNVTSELVYKLKISRANEVYDSESSFKQVTVKVTLVPCPLGFRYHKHNEKCVCALDSVHCNLTSATACIQKGYWHGRIKVSKGDFQHITEPCSSGNCLNAENCIQCPSQGLSDYCKLPNKTDYQCIDNHTGVLCTECMDGYAYTFGAVKCVPVTRCDKGQSVLIILIMLGFILASMALIVLLLKLDKKLKVGYMFSILYYFSVIRYLLAPNNIPQALEVMISVLVSITQLNPHFIGYIPICLTTKSTILEQQMFFYASPLIISLIVLCVVWLSRCCPRYLKFSDNTLLRAISLLMLLSFTAMAETSFNVINPVKFDAINETYVSIEPSTKYLDPKGHVAFFCIALIVEVFLVLPFTFILLFAPLLTRCFNLNKIKPFLDEFQDCYKDKYRWMAGYYFLCRQLYLAVTISPQAGASSLQYTYQIVTLLILTFHSIMMPYKSNWLNALDSFFLANLLFVALMYGLTASTIFESKSNIQTAITGILILFPVLYCLFGFLLALFLKIPKRYRDKAFAFFIRNKKDDGSSLVPGTLEQPLLRSVSTGDEYREPILGLMDDSTTSSVRGRKRSKILRTATVVERPLTTSYNQEWQDNTPPQENERTLSIRNDDIEDRDL